MTTAENLTDQLHSLESDLFTAAERDDLQHLLRRDVRARGQAADQRDAKAWSRIQSRADWERFCAPRLEALRQSLGPLPPVSATPRPQVTRRVEGEGFRIENTVYETGPGVVVTANLYLPASPPDRMPAILIIHSHHNPRTQGELMDMGMTWARNGCAVLIPDQFGYGERRQHPPGPRQDYRFRYINGIKLHLIGETLMGWMVRDTIGAVDLLCGRPDVDRDRIILIGAVAGGGDPAAVTAALDPRIACVVPFNFGGPQPESPHPLSEDAEASFNYMGAGYWESTRSLRLSGREGFLPWVIVASVAPRGLIYAHEFSWDQEHDPVWKRLQQVFAWSNASEYLGFTHGAGQVTGRPPESTHCNNVGIPHRRMIHPMLERAFNIPIPQEYQDRLPEEALMCLPPEDQADPDAIPQPRAQREMFAEMGGVRASAMHDTLATLSSLGRRQHLRREWAERLGDIAPQGQPEVKSHTVQQLDKLRIERTILEVESGIPVPLLLLRPLPEDRATGAVVVAVAHAGKQDFLDQRAAEIAALLEAGIAVCLPEVRGTGETRLQAPRQRRSETTNLSVTEWMLGQTLLGARLRDLRSVLRFLRAGHLGTDLKLALWGDSFAPTNPPDFEDPLIEEDEEVLLSEPLGGLLALFGALYEEGVAAVVARRTIAGYQAILRDTFCYVPHDCLVFDALGAGDLAEVAAALAPRPLRLEALVDGRNCPMPVQEVEQRFALTRQAYQPFANQLSLVPESSADLAPWLVQALGDTA